MSLSVLNDAEFSARLHEGRAFLDGLKAEADARNMLGIGCDLAAAQEHLASAVTEWKRAQALVGLKPWQFLNAKAEVVECSWCNKEFDHLPSNTTHGICPRHAAEFRADLERRRAA
jgi:hypothetical protein